LFSKYTVSFPNLLMPSMIQILIVARLPIIREGLRGLLGPEPDFQLSTLDHYESGALVERVLAARPDVLLVDVDVLEIEGWALLDDLRAVAPSIASLVISDTAEDRRVASALALGAHGYLTRDASTVEMASAIRAAGQGLFVLNPIAAQNLLSEFASAADLATENETDSGRANEHRRQDLIEPLSARELDVVRLIVRGMSNKQIAAELIITEHTVKFHIRAILSKLGAANRTEAVTLALQKGLVSL
jgi:NarL family two-component system response regulator LiaR